MKWFWSNTPSTWALPRCQMWTFQVLPYGCSWEYCNPQLPLVRRVPSCSTLEPSTKFVACLLYCYVASKWTQHFLQIQISNQMTNPSHCCGESWIFTWLNPLMSNWHLSHEFCTTHALLNRNKLVWMKQSIFGFKTLRQHLSHQQTYGVYPACTRFIVQSYGTVSTCHERNKWQVQTCPIRFFIICE